MKIKFKPKKIIKISVIIFLLKSSLILSQDIKYNIIKEISTMDEIHNELLIDSNTSDDMKTVSEIIRDKNRELIDSRDDNIELEIKKENEETSMESKIAISPEKIKKKDSNKKAENKIENTKINDEIIYTSPKIEKNFSDNSSNNANTKSINKKYEPREREKKEKFEEINDKTNRVTALGSAMGAVDLGSTPEKKIRFGAGVGNSSSSQAIAVGIGYAPTDRFRVNTKFSSSTNNMNNNSISVGASYDLDL